MSINCRCNEYGDYSKCPSHGDGTQWAKNQDRWRENARISKEGVRKMKNHREDAMRQEPFMRTILPEKDDRIQKAITEAMAREGASNIDALNAAMIVIVKCLRLYPLGMRETHVDQVFHAIADSAFAE